MIPLRSWFWILAPLTKIYICYLYCQPLYTQYSLKAFLSYFLYHISDKSKALWKKLLYNCNYHIKTLFHVTFNNFCCVRDGTNTFYFRLKKDDFMSVCLSITKHCIRVIFGRKHFGYHYSSPEKDIKIYKWRVRDRTNPFILG